MVWAWRLPLAVARVVPICKFLLIQIRGAMAKVKKLKKRQNKTHVYAKTHVSVV